MPFILLEELGVRAFYVLNPVERPAQGQWQTDEPLSDPFDTSKPTIVLLHCTSMSSAQFHYQIFDPRLREQNNIIAIDSRLSGRTEDISHPGRITLEMVATAHVGVLDVLQVPSYSVVGVGVMGSQAATWVAHKRPEKVKCLALVAPGFMTVPPAIADSFRELPAIFMENKDANGDQSGNFTEDAFQVMCNYFIGAQARLEEQRREYRVILDWRYGAGRPSYDILQVLNWGGGRDPFPKSVIEGIRTPVMIFRGTEDMIVSPLNATQEWADHFTQAQGGVTVTQVTGAPHIIAFTDSNVLNRYLAAFVARNQGG